MVPLPGAKFVPGQSSSRLSNGLAGLPQGEIGPSVQSGPAAYVIESSSAWQVFMPQNPRRFTLTQQGRNCPRAQKATERPIYPTIRRIFASSTGVMMPDSVTIPLIKFAGVTSNAGL